MSEPEKLLTTAQAQGEALGVSRWTIQAMRKASRGTKDNPFTGRLTTYSRMMKWLRTHPDFVASRVFKTTTPPCTAPSPAPATAGISGE